MKETKDKRPDSSEETHDNSTIKGKFFQTMKRHPLVTGGLVLAGAGLAFTAVKLATNGSATQEDERDGVARGVHLETSIAINRSPEELYGIWRDLKMLPLIMTNLESVTDLGNGRSHWVLKITKGVRVKWDAETIQDKSNQLIAWRSVGDADVNNAGSVRFQPGSEGRGTYVRVALNYEPPAGKLGAGVAHLLGYDPEALIKRDLQQFKQMMETGEIATIEGQPSGREAESESDAPRKLSTMGNQSESAAGQGEARPRDAGGRRKMKAVCWNGKHNVQVSNVPDPAILNPNDAIVKVTTTAICGSDLHLYDGYIPTMERGDILGHEFMGEVVETGSAVKKLRIGDRVVVPFTIACGKCFFCRKGLTSACDNSNPNASTAEALYGFSGSGLFGYSHMMGGYAGGQAEFVRVPFADVGPIVIPDGLSDEQVLFLSDIFPTGYMAAENCNIQPGDTVAVWGCGPVGQFAIKSAFLLGAERVIAIDQVPGRLRMAAAEGKADTLNFDDVDIFDKLSEMTGGLGPDACIDAVGLEAHGATIDALYDRAKTALNLATDRLHALRQAIRACRKGGTVSVPGVYGGFLDKFPFGAAFAKGLTFKMGQTNVHKYLHPLLGLIQDEKIDPSFVISHRIRLDDAASAYEAFKNNKDEWTKVVMKPDLN